MRNKAMRYNDIVSIDPIGDFDSKFKFAWNSEKANPPISAEHYRVTWSIENLGLLFFEEHTSLSSPTFLLDSSKTEWYIKLHPKGLCNKVHDFDLCLYRTDDDGNPNIAVTFRFGFLLNEDTTLWLKEKKIKCFRRNAFSSLPVDEGGRRTLSENMFKFCDVFGVNCEMYVTFPGSRYDERLLKPVDYDLINLSFDFSKLMMAIEITDYRVKIPRLNINTHKAILVARSATLREILKDGDYSSEINFNDTSFDSIRRVLHFMYSGNFSMALKGEPPSIGLYECAKKLAVMDLAALLSPKCFRLRSVLKSREFSYTWIIPNFTKRSEFGLPSIKSPRFGIPGENSPKWHQIVDFNRFSDQLGIFVEITEEMEALHSVLKISLVDGNGELFNTNVTTQFKKPREKFGFPEFLKEFSNQNSTYDLLTNDTLRVHCELRFVVSTDYHESHDVTLVGPSNFLDTIKNLSNHLKQLFDTSAFSDVAVKTRDNAMFDVHRSILFARSRKFYSKFMYYNKNDRILDVLDVDPDLVRLMLEYAYSGRLRPMSVGDMLRLHKAANLYVFRSLSLITNHQLASRIDAGNFFELLMETDELEDEYLEEKCMNYVRQNARKIVVTADWENFRKKNAELCRFLITVTRQEIANN